MASFPSAGVPRASEGRFDSRGTSRRGCGFRVARILRGLETRHPRARAADRSAAPALLQITPLGHRRLASLGGLHLLAPAVRGGALVPGTQPRLARRIRGRGRTAETQRQRVLCLRQGPGPGQVPFRSFPCDPSDFGSRRLRRLAAESGGHPCRRRMGGLDVCKLASRGGAPPLVPGSDAFRARGARPVAAGARPGSVEIRQRRATGRPTGRDRSRDRGSPEARIRRGRLVGGFARGIVRLSGGMGRSARSSRTRDSQHGRGRESHRPVATVGAGRSRNRGLGPNRRGGAGCAP
mgnify:CR=1 FL=1